MLLFNKVINRYKTDNNNTQIITFATNAFPTNNTLMRRGNKFIDVQYTCTSTERGTFSFNTDYITVMACSHLHQLVTKSHVKNTGLK